MEAPTSTNTKTHSSDDIILSFGNFGLRKDGNFLLKPATTNTNTNTRSSLLNKIFNGCSSSNSVSKRAAPPPNPDKDRNRPEERVTAYPFHHQETSHGTAIANAPTRSFVNSASVNQWAFPPPQETSSVPTLPPFSNSSVQKVPSTQYKNMNIGGGNQTVQNIVQSQWAYYHPPKTSHTTTKPSFFNSLSGYDHSIWAPYNAMNNTGNGYGSDMQKYGQGRFDWSDKKLDLVGYDSKGVFGNSRKCSLTTSDYGNQYGLDSGLVFDDCLGLGDNGPGSGLVGFDDCCGLGDKGVYADIDCEKMNNGLEEEEFKREVDHKRILDMLRWNGPAEMCFILKWSTLACIFGEQMYKYFIKILNLFDDKYLIKQIPDILSDREGFINAAFCKDGANAIVKLMKRVKNLDLAYSITKILSTRLYDLMTHHIARMVIQRCLLVLGEGPNEILYEEVINNFLELATHEMGCISLNECINTVSGNKKMELLNSIADASDYLSNDPYGNYVVQQVLTLNIDDITSKILYRLEGQLMSLAMKKGGSHVVEKCIDCSDSGMVSVIQEICEERDSVFLLAQDPFGNYVIQKALEKTKAQGYSGLYMDLVRALQPYHSQLNCTRGGKYVLSILRADIQQKKQQGALINGKAHPKSKKREPVDPSLFSLRKNLGEEESMLGENGTFHFE